MKIHFSSSTERTRSYFSSRISRDQDSCQGLEGPSTYTGFHGNFSHRRGGGVILIPIFYVLCYVLHDILILAKTCFRRVGR